MNSYIKTNWVNGSAPALSADNLNKIENGIGNATEALINIEGEVHAARGSYQNLKARLDDTGAPTDEQVAEAVEGYIDNHQEAIVKKAIIANTEMLSPDITFEANNDDVNDYLTASAYVFAADNAYNSNDYQSTNVPADIGSSVNERPNHGTVTIPEGGAKITLIDTVAKIKWSESVSGGDYEVKNLIPNRLYTYVIKNSSGAVIKTGSCKASGQVRIIDAGKAVTYPVSDPTTTSERPLFNIRDLGGWACDDGRLKYGLIYRGCRLNGSYMNNNSVRYGISITESQKAFFKNFLGIRDEIDLRQIKNDPDSGNTETAGDDAIYGTSDDITDTALGVGVDYAIYPIKPYYAGMLSGNAVQNSRYAAIINRIAYDIKNSKPCYVHCLEGADRTGMIAMLILGICGVSRSDIERDYELTSFSKDYIGNRNRRARNDSALSYRWMTLMQHLLGNTTGSTFRDKIIDYVIKIGVTVNEINTIRAGLIDGSPEKIKSPYADAAIQYNLTNIITDNPISSIALYQPFEVKLTALNMTDIQSVTVMMGGTDITSTAYNAERILIPKVTGDITITASATDVVIPDVSGKADKATTLAGYGITDGLQTPSGGTVGQVLTKTASAAEWKDIPNEYEFVNEIPQNANHSQKYVLPDGYIYEWQEGSASVPSDYNTKIINKRPSTNANYQTALNNQAGTLCSDLIPVDTTWGYSSSTSGNAHYADITISGISKLIPAYNNNAIIIYYYRRDNGNAMGAALAKDLATLNQPAAGSDISLPVTFSLIDQTVYFSGMDASNPAASIGYVRVMIGISSTNITEDDVANVKINVPFYDTPGTQSGWVSTGIKHPYYIKDSIFDISTNQKLFVVGDSIAYGYGGSGVKIDSWVDYLIDHNGYDSTNSSNLSESGLGFCTTSTRSHTVTDIVGGTSFASADVVIVALGINDWKNANATLANLWSGMEYTFNKIRTDNPYCKIYYLLPFNVSFAGQYSSFYGLGFKGDNDATKCYGNNLQTFISLIKAKFGEATFKAFNVDVIDMTECPAINRNNITTALFDNLHPSADTQKELGKEIARTITLQKVMCRESQTKISAFTNDSGYLTLATLPTYNGGVQ